MPTDQRDAVIDAVAGQIPTLLIGAALVVAGLVAAVARLVGRYTMTARRLTAETRLLLEANPEHRLDRSGPAELTELATAVDDLAERRRIAEREVDSQIRAAQASLAQERNRLAALMAELAAAVIVCNVDGQILLYNAAARSVLGDDAAVGLGRSVFGIIDRDLLAHALDRIEHDSATSSHVATTVRGEQLLQVRVAPARGPDGGITGFVLLLEDLTDRMNRSSRRDDLLRDLTEGTRSSLGSIQAAIETVVDYPDMDAEERRQFLGIVREESHLLGRRVETWVAESGDRSRSRVAANRDERGGPPGGRVPSARARGHGRGVRAARGGRRAVGQGGQPCAGPGTRAPGGSAARRGRCRGIDIGRDSGRRPRSTRGELVRTAGPSRQIPGLARRAAHRPRGVECARRRRSSRRRDLVRRSGRGRAGSAAPAPVDGGRAGSGRKQPPRPRQPTGVLRFRPLRPARSNPWRGPIATSATSRTRSSTPRPPAWIRPAATRSSRWAPCGW